MTADDVRARFEAWATERGLLIRRAAMICGRAAGPYDRDEVQSAWNAYRAAHADLSGEVRELVEAVVTHWMDDRGLVITSEFRNGPTSSSDYRTAYYIPCVKKGRKIVPVPALAKFTQEKP